MTADQRIEKLLNRAGQTFDESRDYTHDETMSAMSMPFLELVMKYLECVRLIDTMETALENVCGERDYLRSVVCGLCTNFHEDGADACETCIIGDGVPEYWSANDD